MEHTKIACDIARLCAENGLDVSQEDRMKLAGYLVDMNAARAPVEQSAHARYYRSRVTIEILSEDEPITNASLEDIQSMITTGDCSGVISFDSGVEISPAEAARNLQEQGSSPGLFRLRDDGTHEDDESDDPGN